LIDEAQGSML